MTLASSELDDGRHASSSFPQSRLVIALDEHPSSSCSDLKNDGCSRPQVALIVCANGCTNSTVLNQSRQVFRSNDSSQLTQKRITLLLR